MITDNTVWTEFQFRCKPGDINRFYLTTNFLRLISCIFHSRKPCLISPYHFRIDWLMWFAAFQNYQQSYWLVHLADKIVSGDLIANELLDPSTGNPFFNSSKEEKRIPTFVRAVLYEVSYKIILQVLTVPVSIDSPA